MGPSLEPVRELEALLANLGTEDRELLLEELLVAYAADRAEQMGAVVEAYLLDCAGREWLESLQRGARTGCRD